MENWRFIEANSDYMVSDHGRILSFKGKSKLIISSSITAKVMSTWPSAKGIYVGYSVHRLVATAFIPNPKRLPQVNHLDGNKLNNHVANLEWCDAYDNVMHAIRPVCVRRHPPSPRPLCHNGRGRKYPASLSIHERTGKRGTNEP